MRAWESANIQASALPDLPTIPPSLLSPFQIPLRVDPDIGDTPIGDGPLFA
ncbi:MAG: hypothetical protein JWN03_4753 [Nocardia sp.]|nr:hypothetical protein [Nocardia sp.]